MITKNMLKLKLIDFWKKIFFVILHFFILFACFITNVKKNKNANWRVFSKKFFHFFILDIFFLSKLKFSKYFSKKMTPMKNF